MGKGKKEEINESGETQEESLAMAMTGDIRT
jgi:hypothetical protein